MLMWTKQVGSLLASGIMALMLTACIELPESENPDSDNVVGVEDTTSEGGGGSPSEPPVVNPPPTSPLPTPVPPPPTNPLPTPTPPPPTNPLPTPIPPPTTNPPPAVNQPPVAQFTMTPGEGTTQTEIHFNAAASTDGDGQIVEYLWSFGDGNEASGVTVSHVYQTPGIRTVSLRVVDNDGAIHQRNRTINISESPSVTLPWYLSVRAVSEDGQQGPFSNEVHGDLSPNQLITLVWNAPNTTLDGACTTISGYEIQMGGAPGVYTHAITVHSNFTGLSCVATGVNTCGNTYTCEVDVTVPGS